MNTKWPPISLGDKQIKIPLIQGGMGVGISMGGLAGAVAKEGAAGIISNAQIGFREADFEKNPFQANLRAMESEYQKARKTAPDGVIGFNIMVALKHYEEYVRHAAAIGCDLIISGAGLPTELPRYVEGTDTKIAPIVSTEKSARVIFRYWEKKHHCAPDFVIIEGPLAGGHLGFAKDQLSYYTFDVYEKEVRNIIEVCREYAARFNKEIPVVLAGGISTKEAADHSFSLGVDAIQAATRFVTTYECDASDAFKKAYLDASKEDIILIDSPVGLPGAVRNKFSDTIMSGGRIAPVRCRGCLKNCRPDKIPYCITDALITSVTGDAKNGLVFCGADAWRCDHLEYAEDVIESLLS